MFRSSAPASSAANARSRRQTIPALSIRRPRSWKRQPAVRPIFSAASPASAEKRSSSGVVRSSMPPTSSSNARGRGVDQPPESGESRSREPSRCCDQGEQRATLAPPRASAQSPASRTGLARLSSAWGAARRAADDQQPVSARASRAPAPGRDRPRSSRQRRANQRSGHLAALDIAAEPAKIVGRPAGSVPDARSATRREHPPGASGIRRRATSAVKAPRPSRRRERRLPASRAKPPGITGHAPPPSRAANTRRVKGRGDQLAVGITGMVERRDDLLPDIVLRPPGHSGEQGLAPRASSARAEHAAARRAARPACRRRPAR